MHIRLSIVLFYYPFRPRAVSLSTPSPNSPDTGFGGLVGDAVAEGDVVAEDNWVEKLCHFLFDSRSVVRDAICQAVIQ